MPTNPLRTNHDPGTAYKVSGETLNRHNDISNAMNAGHVIQRCAAGINAAGIKVDIPTVPFIFGIAQITGIANTCPTEAGESGQQPYGGKGFPCGNINHYTCEFRYYDQETGQYIKYGETLDLDANAYYEAADTQASRESSGPGYGPIPGYLIGDTTPAYLDVQRDKLIPVQSPPSDPSTACFVNLDNREIAESTNSATSQGSQTPPLVEVSVVEFYIEQSRAGVDQDFRVIGTLSFPLSAYSSLNGLTFDSKATFNTAPCPHGTLFRIRAVLGHNPQDNLVVKTYWQRLRFTGLGRRNPLCVAASVDEPQIRGGMFIYTWQPDESTTNRFKDAPGFNSIPGVGSQPGLIQVNYFDTKDEWMIGVEFHACIQVTNRAAESDSGCCECKKFQTAFGHLSSISVAVGDIIKQGDTIGFVGDLGDPNDPHLHYEARFGATKDNFTVANDPTNGQSFNIDDVQVFPKVGARAAGTAPGAAQGTAAEIAHAKSTMTTTPISGGHCTWEEHLGSALHTGAKYYAKDLYCTTNNQAGAEVVNFVDALTVVIAIDAQYGGVLLEHYCDECVTFKNTESQEAVPAYGVMRVTKGKVSGKRTVFEIGKPNDEFQRLYLINGEDEVPAGEYGCGKWLDEAGVVKYAEFSPEIGESWGAKEDSWALVKNRPGFTVVGEINEEETLTFAAIQYQVNTNLAVSDSDMTKGIKGSVMLWMRNADTGEWEETEYEIAEANPLGTDLTGELFISLEWDSGEWLAACYEQ